MGGRTFGQLAVSSGSWLALSLMSTASMPAQPPAVAQAKSDARAEEIKRLWSEAGKAYKAGAYAQAIEATARVVKLIEQKKAAPTVEYARALNDHALSLRAGGFPAQAEIFDRRALALRIQLLGDRHPDSITSLDNLAHDLRERGRFSEAEPLYRKALAIGIEVQGERHPDSITGLNNLAVVLTNLGRMSEAEPLYRKALALRMEVQGERHPDTLNSLQNWAFHIDRMGRASEAEQIHRRLLALRTEVLGERHPDTILSLESLANNLRANGRAREAEPLQRRALALRIEILGERHPTTIDSLSFLAADLAAQGRAKEVEPIYRHILALSTEILGKNHPATIASLASLAVNLDRQDRASEAEPLYRKAWTLRNELLGERHPDTIASLFGLACAIDQQGRAAEAEPLYRTVLALRTEVLGSQHPARIVAASYLAHNLLRQSGREEETLALARLAVDLIRSRRAEMGETARGEAQRTRDENSRRGFFRLLSDADWEAGMARPADQQALGAEAFMALQDAMSGPTSRAVALAAARRLSELRSGELGRLAAERQSLADQWVANDAALTSTLADIGPDASARRDSLTKAGAAFEARMAAIDTRLRAEAPDYFAATRPQAIALDQAQAILEPDEAVLIVVPTAYGTHLVALTREDVHWKRVDLTSGRIATVVGMLRAQLDPAQQPVTESGPGFDRSAAFQLYQALIAPMLPALAGKQQLFVAADGALASLPFSVLVSKPPEGDDSDPSALRDTHWLADDFALVQIPSFQSLHFLRSFGKPARSPQQQTSFIGFGDPVLADYGAGASRRVSAIQTADILGAGVTRDGGGLANVDALRSLISLPGTGTELRELGRALGAPPTALYLGPRATESQVRHMRLDEVRILAFATHGAMAGEIGVAEPGLILTPPRQASETDDGYLAASEISELRLNADWVILSACNTAAGNADGSPGLSGLARAFFYAGARNLLVSHWPVRDDIAPIITAATIRMQQSEPGLSRAKAFQRALYEVRQQPGSEHPSAWAPFTLVGDGQ